MYSPKGRTRSEQRRIGKVGEKWGGWGGGEKTHELEKNAKILEKINTIITVSRMSKRIFQATLCDPDFPGAGAETKDDQEHAKSGDSSSNDDSNPEGQQSPLKSSKAEGQPPRRIQLPMLMTNKNLHQLGLSK